MVTARFIYLFNDWISDESPSCNVVNQEKTLPTQLSEKEPLYGLDFTLPRGHLANFFTHIME